MTAQGDERATERDRKSETRRGSRRRGLHALQAGDEKRFMGLAVTADELRLRMRGTSATERAGTRAGVDWVKARITSIDAAPVEAEVGSADAGLD